MAWKEEKGKIDEGSFSMDPGLTDVQERDLRLGGLFEWGRDYSFMWSLIYEKKSSPESLC